MRRKLPTYIESGCCCCCRCCYSAFSPINIDAMMMKKKKKKKIEDLQYEIQISFVYETSSGPARAIRDRDGKKENASDIIAMLQQ